MPSPSYIVTLTDSKGDEWEVRIFGSHDTEQEITRLAVLRARALNKDEPRFNPIYPVKMTKVELLNDAKIEGPIFNCEVVDAI